MRGGTKVETNHAMNIIKFGINSSMGWSISVAVVVDACRNWTSGSGNKREKKSPRIASMVG